MVRCTLPPELEYVGAQGPTKPEKLGADLVFAPIAGMEPKAEAIFKVKARAKKAGDARVRVEVSSDQHRRPIVKEEATRIYGDDGP